MATKPKTTTKKTATKTTAVKTPVKKTTSTTSKTVAKETKDAKTPKVAAASTSKTTATKAKTPAKKKTDEPKPWKNVKKMDSIPKLLFTKAEALYQEELDYMESEQFDRRGIEKELFDEELNALPMVAWYQPTRDDAFEADKNVGSPQLMKPPEERLMFLRFNFAKKKIGIIQRRIKRNGMYKKDATELVQWHNKFEHLREYLVRTNLALVLAMAKRTRLGDVDFAEVVSEGNMALIRAVDKFNVDKGFKFSTYACRAILKAFSRTAMKHSRHRQRFPVEFEPDLEKSNWLEIKRDSVKEDCVDELKSIVDTNVAGLSDVEQTVLKHRFNWDQEQSSPLTLEQVGRIIGVTKERVRQIQNKALTKIRKLMEEGVLRHEARARLLDSDDISERQQDLAIKRIRAEILGEAPLDVDLEPVEEPARFEEDELVLSR
ncbi:MAG: sigma-70 family RNA polymerase sigma factor [Planctomycetota bacterium]